MVAAAHHPDNHAGYDHNCHSHASNGVPQRGRAATGDLIAAGGLVFQRVDAYGEAQRGLGGVGFSLGSLDRGAQYY